MLANLSSRAIRQIEHTVISKLRHPARPAVLRDYLDDDLLHIPDHVRARILGQPVAPRKLTRCERYGWFDARPEHSDRRTCGACPCPLIDSWTGRP